MNLTDQEITDLELSVEKERKEFMLDKARQELRNLDYEIKKYDKQLLMVKEKKDALLESLRKGTYEPNLSPEEDTEGDEEDE